MSRDSRLRAPALTASCLGPGPGRRACPYIPWQGGAVTPVLRVGPRLTHLSHLLSSQSGVGT